MMKPTLEFQSGSVLGLPWNLTLEPVERFSLQDCIFPNKLIFSTTVADKSNFY